MTSGKPTREASGSCQYQNKSPHPTRGGDLEGVRGRAEPSPVAIEKPRRPKYIDQCARQGGRGWRFAFWQTLHPDKKTIVPFTCGSARCVDANGKPTDCARHNASVLFARIVEALEPYDSADMVTAVFTIDRNGFYGGKQWLDVNEAFRDLGHMSELFLKRIRRFAKKVGWAPIKSEWIQVVETHKSGWPHVNVLIVHAELAAYVRADVDARLASGMSDTASRLMNGELKAMALAAGFGTRSTIEPVRSKGALAGYITKIAAHQPEMLGELSKLTQTPVNAPQHFRRYRSGKGFLPPRKKNPNWTGTLVRRIYDPTWGYISEAMRSKTKPTPADRQKELLEVELIDEQCFHEELEKQARGEPCGPPHTVYILNGQRVYKEPKDDRDVSSFGHLVLLSPMCAQEYPSSL